MADFTLSELRMAKADLEASLCRSITASFSNFIERTGEYPEGLEVTVITHRTLGRSKPDATLVTGVKVDLGRV